MALSILTADQLKAQIPWSEDFSGLENGELPDGWTRGDTENWGTFNSNNAGGTAPEMVFWWQPVSSGVFELQSPPINTEGFTELTLSFKHRINNFGDPGEYTCSVVATADGQSFTIVEWVDPDFIASETVSYQLSAEEHGVGASDFTLSWIFEGSSDNITQWDIDDIELSIEAGDAEFTVSPDAWAFDDQQIGLSSDDQTFTIENTGSQPLLLSPDQIRLQGDGPQSSNVKIMTYNIWFDSQNWPARRDYMLQEMRASEADIICLQEVIQRPNLPNQAETLADSLGFFYTFSSRDAEGAPTRFGNAILSRYPIIEDNWVALDPLDDFRTAIHARVEVDGNIIDVYNTHLHNAAVNTHIRETQLQDVRSFIEFTKADDALVFLCGDFNANPDWEEMDLVYDLFTDVYPIFHENHLDPEHGTLNFNLDHQARRIDYIFFSNESADRLAPKSAKILLNELSDTGVWGSDHFAVFAEFDILSDADDFVLTNLEDDVVLMEGEQAEVAVRFEPKTVGEKSAFLVVGDVETPISGLAFDATVREFPYLEDFSGLGNGQLPQGWTRSHPNWGAFNNNAAGGEAPELNFWWQPVTTGVLFITTPRIETPGLDSMVLSFRHRIVDFGDPGPFTLRVENITEDSTYTIVEWVDPGNIDANLFSIQLNSQEHGIGSDHMQLSFVFEGTTSDISQWDIDDIRLDALAAIGVSPDEGGFPDQVIDEPSEAITFTISNIGGDTLRLSPDDIRVVGADEDAFILTNIEADITLAAAEETSVSVVFFPTREGMHTADLQVGSVGLPLSGNSVDPTIREIPWFEGFDDLLGGGIPVGWRSTAVNWGTFNASNAGGEAPEMVFWWQPEGEGVYPLTTPRIITGELDSLLFSFKYRIRNFGAPGIYTLRVLAIADGEERVVQEWVDPDFVEATTFSTILTAEEHGLGAEDFRLSWVFDGRTDNLTQWDIDDITLDTISNVPVLSVEPNVLDFGNVEIEAISMPLDIVLTNTGGGQLSIDPLDIFIEGDQDGDFIFDDIEEPIQLGPQESAFISVTFAPLEIGPKSATFIIAQDTVLLRGNATEISPYFTYSDFTIVENGREFTNVGGFREVAGMSSGNLTAVDVQDIGEFGGAAVQLDYDLSLDESRSVYFMWAFPPVDLSAFNRIVVIARAEQEATDVKISLQDTDGINAVDGGSHKFISIGQDWTLHDIAVEDFDLEEWADNHPDMSRIQKIDMEFVRDITNPESNSILVDLIGLHFEETVSTEDPASLDSEWLMMPNPANNTVWIDVQNEGSLSVYDVSGRMVIHQDVGQGLTRLNIAHLPPGAYTVQYIQGKLTSNKKLIKQ